ncbi:MAG: phospho-N-acetylmuramoyl-pentapeptide-transferase [Caldisericia bacterium]|nr:phospho-N-acetylmuramoyl-pentapeptide-transferase [Caldisericia bacterium]MDD4613939.1 phospho-N-acetylmuramoyl-pentapeptide-transferase [Caldisericia bacterium]
MVVQTFIFFWGSFLLVLITMPFVIRHLRKQQIGQYVREEGPKDHLVKAGTPTMGGMVFIVVAVLLYGLYMWGSSRLFLDFLPIYLLLSYACIGFLDDYRKTVLRSPYGLKAREDITLQILASIPVIFGMYSFSSCTFFTVGCVIFEIIFILSVVNSVNLTDGIDGLLSSVSVPIFFFYAIVLYSQGQYSGVVFALVMAGTLLGFVIFNAYPAKVFMGNVGSFAIGGAMVALAIRSQTEFYLLLIGLLFVWEALSVIIQVSWFKITKRKYGDGRRIFLMSPFHHHLELKGYSETHIVVLFTSLEIILCTFAGAIYFL